VLRAWFDQGALRTETWDRPNRRFIGGGLFLPGSQRGGVNKAAFLIDTSGSVFCDSVALQCVRNEAQAALDDGVIDEAIVIYGDTRVTRVDTYRTGDEIEFDPCGGSGTDLKPLFKHVADEIDDASLIVCFTDLYIGDPGPEPHCPVLFAVHGYPRRRATPDRAGTLGRPGYRCRHALTTPGRPTGRPSELAIDALYHRANPNRSFQWLCHWMWSIQIDTQACEHMSVQISIGCRRSVRASSVLREPLERSRAQIVRIKLSGLRNRDQLPVLPPRLWRGIPAPRKPYRLAMD